MTNCQKWHSLTNKCTKAQNWKQWPARNAMLFSNTTQEVETQLIAAFALDHCYMQTSLNNINEYSGGASTRRFTMIMSQNSKLVFNDGRITKSTGCLLPLGTWSINETRPRVSVRRILLRFRIWRFSTHEKIRLLQSATWPCGGQVLALLSCRVHTR